MHRKTANVARILAGLMFVAICASSAFAQEQATPTKIAVVSLVQIQAEYRQLQAQEQNLGVWLQDRRSYAEGLTNYVFLPKKEFEEALELTRKSQPLSDQDQTRLDELKGISSKNEERYATLRAKPDRTAEETAEFNALQDMYDASAQTLQGVQRSIMDELGQRRQTALAGLMDTVEATITTVAEQAGYEVVLDADMVFYGGDDITRAVLERLNADAEEPAETGEAGGQADEGNAQQDDQGGGEGGEQTGGQGG